MEAGVLSYDFHKFTLVQGITNLRVRVRVRVRVYIGAGYHEPFDMDSHKILLNIYICIYIFIYIADIQ